jgi:hypothetical protein
MVKAPMVKPPDGDAMMVRPEMVKTGMVKR